MRAASAIPVSWTISRHGATPPKPWRTAAATASGSFHCRRTVARLRERSSNISPYPSASSHSSRTSLRRKGNEIAALSPMCRSLRRSRLQLEKVRIVAGGREPDFVSLGFVDQQPFGRVVAFPSPFPLSLERRGARGPRQGVPPPWVLHDEVETRAIIPAPENAFQIFLAPAE